jgi:hypothetical protein
VNLIQVKEPDAESSSDTDNSVLRQIVAADASETIDIKPTTGEIRMADSEDTGSESEERIPTLQKLLDNHFLLLFIGVAMPTVLYIVWGVMEIVSIPIAK